MKNGIIMTLLAFSFVFSLSSCDDDKKMAVNLSGEWQGYFGASIIRDSRNGGSQVYYSDESYIKFIPDYPFATRGYGIEIDYYDRGPYEYEYYTFDWKIDDENLILYYPHDHGRAKVIDHYHLNLVRFSGYIEDESFCLHKLSSDFDWGNYCDDYGYCRRTTWW